tara:strand:- start:170 stop:1258 length:1089 start_codon:yes stop_codon:yes gene_type:complete
MKEYMVYVGTYTNGESQSEGIYVYRFDLANGDLTHLSTCRGIDDPSFLDYSPGRKFLYAVSEVDQINGIEGGGIAAFSIDQTTGGLTFLNMESTHGAYPCHVQLDKSAKYVLAANYMGGNIAVFPRLDNGKVGPACDVVQLTVFSNVNPERQEAPHAHSVNFSPDNKWVYVANLGADKVMIYGMDLEQGKLIPASKSYVDISPGEGPRHWDFHPNGRWAYLINELGNTINSYDYNPEDGSLTAINTVKTLPKDFDEWSNTADIHVHPNGKFVYGTNRGHDSLVMCEVDQATGALTVLGYQPTGGSYPRNFGIDPTGTFLLVANRDTNDITTFFIDRDSGLLLPNGQVTTVPQPVCIRFMAIG